MQNQLVNAQRALPAHNLNDPSTIGLGEYGWRWWQKEGELPRRRRERESLCVGCVGPARVTPCVHEEMRCDEPLVLSDQFKYQIFVYPTLREMVTKHNTYYIPRT